MKSLLLTMRFDRYQIFPETRDGSLTNLFSTLSRKTVDGKRWYPPFLSRSFRCPRNSENQKFRLWKFPVLREKSFAKTWYPFPILKFLRYQKFFETQKDSLTKFFSSVSQKLLTEIGDTPPLIQKIFDTKKILRNRRQSGDAAFSMHRKFRNQKVSYLQQIAAMKFSGTARKKIHKIWYLSFLIHKNFSTPEIFET